MSWDPLPLPVVLTSTADSPIVRTSGYGPRGRATRKGEEDSLEERQWKDPALLPVIQYLENGVLPTDERKAREIGLTHSWYTVVDKVLYHIENDKTLRVFAISDWKGIFEEAHSGTMGGHLRGAKVHCQLAKHNW